jgi:hypothetical protein
VPPGLAIGRESRRRRQRHYQPAVVQMQVESAARRLGGCVAKRSRDELPAARPLGQCCRYDRQHCTGLALWAVHPVRFGPRRATKSVETHARAWRSASPSHESPSPTSRDSAHPRVVLAHGGSDKPSPGRRRRVNREWARPNARAVREVISRPAESVATRAPTTAGERFCTTKIYCRTRMRPILA